MYYALKELTIGRGEKVAAGQPIPSASSWTYPILKAHLNLGWIEERPDPVVEEKPADPAPVEAAEKAAEPSEPKAKPQKKTAKGSRK